jgi:hypothetical protein
VEVEPLEHSVWPDGHVEVHIAATHACIGVHAVPHAPQLCGSPVGSTHALAQQTRPDAHGGPPPQPITHTPAMQTVPPGHACAHAPQFTLSVSRLVSQPSNDIPSQLPNPERHSPIVHTPPLHAGVAFGGGGHACAQAPQLFGSVASLTQAKPQHASPIGQPHVHAPATHVSPGGHALLHAPQLRGSLFVSVQPPEQHCEGAHAPPHAVVTHAPAEHTWLAAQA